MLPPQLALTRSIQYMGSDASSHNTSLRKECFLRNGLRWESTKRCSSTLIRNTFTFFDANSFVMRSKLGSSSRQGPHQVAQKFRIYKESPESFIIFSIVSIVTGRYSSRCVPQLSTPRKLVSRSKRRRIESKLTQEPGTSQ